MVARQGGDPLVAEPVRNTGNFWRTKSCAKFFPTCAKLGQAPVSSLKLGPRDFRVAKEEVTRQVSKCMSGLREKYLGRPCRSRHNPVLPRSLRVGDSSQRVSAGGFVKIGCHCGATISDSADSLSHKAHLTPDQDLYGVWDGIDDAVIDRVASGELALRDAYVESRRIISAPTRLMWQCFDCGRLYIDGPDGKMHCFVPETSETEKRILRSRGSN